MVKEKKCPACGLVKTADEFYKSKQSKTGLRSYCIVCQNRKNSEKESKYKETRAKYRTTEKYKKIKRDYYRKNKKKIYTQNRKWALSKRGKWASYKACAQNRCIEWNINREEFESFWQKDCFYCGSPIDNIGIDRVDNDRGYSIDNIVPCCTMCNKMKMDISQKKFIERVKLIANKCKD